MPVLAADGCHITTVEGVGNIHQLHPVQQLMVDFHGSQCGYCTPGIIVSLYTLVSNGTTVLNHHYSEHLDGNLCRCTGYRPIQDVASALAAWVGPCGTPCQECPQNDNCTRLHHDQVSSSSEMVSSSTELKWNLLSNRDFGDHWHDQATKMTKFILQQHATNNKNTIPLRVETHDACWISPKTLDQLLHIFLREGPCCKIVVGNTEVGIETRFKHAVYTKLVYPDPAIPELYDITVSDQEIVIGACCSLSTIQETCYYHQTLNGDTNTNLIRTLRPIHNMLRWFASTQIRNVACLGGNLVTASPISDMNPVLSALGAKLVLVSMDPANKNSTLVRRSMSVADFFVQYRTVDLQPHELVECIRVPVLSDLDFCTPFKQARRREDDISIVTSGQRIKLSKEADGSYRIVEAVLSYGGMAPTTVMATATAQSLIGSTFCSESFQKASKVLLDEMNLPETVPGGQAAYRMTLATSFLRKMFLTVAKALVEMDVTMAAKLTIDPNELSSLTNFLEEPKPSFRGTQQFPAPKVAHGLEEQILSQVDVATSTNSAVQEKRCILTIFNYHTGHSKPRWSFRQSAVAF
jgi:xanthine dehydrogenase/oxidase